MRTPTELTAHDNRLTVALACGAAFVTGLLLLAWLAGVPAAGADEPNPDLTGTWVLDPELSEDPMEKMRERRGSEQEDPDQVPRAFTLDRLIEHLLHLA